VKCTNAVETVGGHDDIVGVLENASEKEAQGGVIINDEDSCRMPGVNSTIVRVASLH